MPQAIPAFAAWAVSTFTTATATSLAAAWEVGAGTAAIYAGAYLTATVAIGAGLGALARAVGPHPGAGSGLNQSSPIQMTRSPITPRRVIYGQTRVSGPLVYAQVTGTKNEYLHLVIALAGHECQAINDIYFNDEIVPLDGSGNATGKYAGLVRVKKHLGSSTQTADTDLVSESGGLWTSAHKLQGICYVYVRLKYDTSVMPGGIPNVSAVVQGAKVYDAASGLTIWTANVASCIRDYLTNGTYGLGFDASAIDAASFLAAVNLCDEAVTKADATSEARYSCNGAFDTTSDPATVLNYLTAAMSGWVVFVGGKCYLGGGAHAMPSTPALTESDLRAPLSVQTKMSLRDTCNRVKGTYVSPGDLYQPVDFPEVSNSTYLAEDGGFPIWRDLQLGFTTSAATAQRLAKIELERTRQDIVATLPCKLTALRVQAGDVVEVTNARFGWTNKLFLVTDLKFAVYNAAGAMALGVDLTVRETAAEVWDWSSGEETTVDPSPNTSLPNPWTVAAPSSFVAAVASFRQPDGSLVPRMQLTWASPAEQFVLSGGRIRIQYKKHTDSDWIEVGAIKGDQTLFFLNGLLFGTNYDFQIRAESNLGVISVWVQQLNIAFAADTTPPSAPTGLAFVVGTGKSVSLSWNANAETDFDGDYTVYRALHGGTLAKVANLTVRDGKPRFVDVEVTLGTNYDYAVTATDETGNESAKSSIVSPTPSVVGVGSVDATPPNDPTAATKTSEGVYFSDDGTVLSYLEFTVPSSPTRAAGVNVLLKVHGDSQWEIKGQFAPSGNITGVRIRGLTPGVSYDVATEAFSAFGVYSNVIAATSSPFTAPVKTALPTAPSSLTLISGSNSQFGRPASYLGGAICLSIRINWAANTDVDFKTFEWVTTGFGQNTDAAADAAAVAGSTTFTQTAEVVLSAIVNLTQYFRVRAIDRSDNKSAWVNATGSSSVASYWGQPAGNMSEQSSSAVVVTGLQTGGSGARKVVARYQESVVFSLTGGATYEDKGVNISGRGFNTKPDVGFAPVANDDAISCRYNYDNGSNSSTQAWVKFTRFDGGVIAPGTGVRISCEFVEYV